MITNITTGMCSYRAQRNKKPFFVSWQDRDQIYYAYFASPFVAGCYKNKMINESQEQLNRTCELMLNKQ